MIDQQIVIKGGTLIDGTGAQPISDSIIVISGIKITKVGSLEEVDVPKNAKIIDATGRTVIPSFIDSHTHFILMGIRTRTTVDLSKTKSITEVVNQVKKQLINLPRGAWVTGHGWDESGWREKRYPTREDLDKVSQENPITLTPYYGHLMIVNTPALELAKITNETPDPPGGKIDRDPITNDATGILREEAMELIQAVKPTTTKEECLTGIKEACEIALKWGCASVHDMGSKALDINAYQTAIENGFLKVRAYVMPDAQFTETMLDGLEVLGVKTRFGDEFLRLGAIKMYIDGSMGSRTAMFSDPYADDPTTCGLFTITPETLEKRVNRVHKLGMQVAIHAIGDRGIDIALNAIETALKQEPRKNHRHRIEHCEVVTEEQIQRIKDLGIIPSMQPNFVGEWGQSGGMYEQRLGQNRLKLCNPFKKLLDEEIRIAFGSDCGYCPPWPFNPIYGLWAAINHPIKESRISLVDAVKCYTYNGAYASFEEDLKGSIEPGKLADITILTKDLVSIPQEKIKNVRVEKTVINGNVLWKAS